MSERFIIKYCNLIDADLVIDTLKRMPQTMIVSNYLYVNGLICSDRVKAEHWKRYYERICGFQRSLVQEVTGFNLETIPEERGYGLIYVISDNTGKKLLKSHDKTIASEFKDWLEMEVNQ